MTQRLEAASRQKLTLEQVMAARMETSRTHVDRLLDPDNLRIQFHSLVHAASAIGKHIGIRLVNNTTKA